MGRRRGVIPLVGAAQSPFRVDRVDRDGGWPAVRISGTLTLRELPGFRAELRRLLGPSIPTLVFDVSGLERIDAAAAALLVGLASPVSGAPGEIVGASGEVAAMLGLMALRGAPPAAAPRRYPGLLEQIGSGTLRLWDEAKGILGFFGDALVATGAALRLPRSVRWRGVVPLMERAGAGGVPIVVLINFLVGLILGFQAAVQLAQVGANIFVPDLVGIAVVREIGPLMTAIIVTGRSGAAYAAEFGTMVVNEELDALETLRLDPYQFLVLPRVVALLAMVPLLTMIADLMGILGGLVVGVAALGLTARTYLAETRQALTLWHVGSGLVKSIVFAGIVALAACQRGFATRGGAAGVGRTTTAAVVTTLFLLVAADAAFTALFHVFGL